MALPAPAPARPDKELLTAWMLLLLGDKPSHGYQLRRELESRALEIDPSAMYRALRDLEDEGTVRSRWTNSAAGPPRRLYRLTRKGRRSLDTIAVLITTVRDSHESFLRAYDDARGRPAAPVAETVENGHSAPPEAAST